MRRLRNRWWALILSLVLVLLTAGCGGASQPGQSDAGHQQAGGSQSAGSGASAGDTIKIGVIVAETGPASSMGKPEADAARLLHKQLQGQSVNGKKVEIVVRDYETNDTTAVVAMKKLVSEDKVVAVVGGTQTSTSVAIGQVATEHQIPLLTLAPVTQYSDYIYQIPHTNEMVLTKLIDYLKKNNIGTVAWINARDAFGQSGLPVFEKLADMHGIKIVGVEDFDAAATDMTVPLTNIKPKNPGAVIVWSRPPGAGIVAKNFKQLGFKVPIIQSHAVGNKGFLDQLGPDGEGVLVLGSKLNVVDQLPDSDYKQMLKKFHDEFTAEYKYDAGQFGGYAYDGLQLIVKAIADGHDNAEKIRDYLQSGASYRGVSGTFIFSKENHAGLEPDGLGLLQISNQSWKLVD